MERGDSRSSSDSSSGRPPLAPPASAPDPESYSYVQLTAVHDYMYPVVEGEGGSLKKRPQQPALPSKRKERCRYCQVNIDLLFNPFLFKYFLIFRHSWI